MSFLLASPFGTPRVARGGSLVRGIDGTAARDDDPGMSSTPNERNPMSNIHPDGCDRCGLIRELYHSESTGLSLCGDCDAAAELIAAAASDDMRAEDLRANPASIRTADDVDAAIRGQWFQVCREFPNATTPMVARKTAEDIGVDVARVFQAFGQDKPRT